MESFKKKIKFPSIVEAEEVLGEINCTVTINFHIKNEEQNICGPAQKAVLYLQSSSVIERSGIMRNEAF